MKKEQIVDMIGEAPDNYVDGRHCGCTGDRPAGE